VKANRFYETQSGLRAGLGIEVGFHNALSGTRLEKPFPGISGNVCRTQAAHTSIGLGPLTFIDRVYASLLKYSQGNSKLCHFGPVLPGRVFNHTPGHPVSLVALWKGGS